ncbi:MAG TPA: aryl-sulfate sulfotransferase [Candidatus Nanoarchaeia archaeon]|nr:aryl-sulfate sulfotransferase [Candidatus Nanoarchaeia archaeon]
MTKAKVFVFIVAVVLTVILVISEYPSFVNSQTAQSLVLPCTVVTTGNAWQGNLTFGVSTTNSTSGITTAYLVIMNTTNGAVSYYQQSAAGYGVAKNVGLNTVMFQGGPVLGGANSEPEQDTSFWNFVTNTTVEFPNVFGHHDVDYNPVNNTFLTLTDYVIQLGNNTFLFDKIVELDSSGNILWSWDTYSHIPLTEADPFNLTATYNGVTVIDFAHSNALVWDYKNGIVYLNCRHTNTFYAINQTTSNIMWACGQFGNFTLLGSNGTQVPSLWYHSHDLEQISPNVFSMFDNDYDNITNPNDAHSGLIDVTLNFSSMTAQVTWSYSAPTQYWTEFFGANVRLPNGDRIGDFGTPTHQFPQNQPWVGNNTGAVLIEVNQTGQVVRTLTFPVGWQIYRIDAITNQNPFTLPAPPPTPAPATSGTVTYPSILQSSPSSQTSSPTPTPSPSSFPTELPTPALSSTSLSSAIPSSASSTSPTLTPTQSTQQTPTAQPTQTIQPSTTPPNSSNNFETATFAAILSVAVAILVVVGLFFRNRKERKQENTAA